MVRFSYILFFSIMFCFGTTKAENQYIAKSVNDYLEVCDAAFGCLDKVSPELSVIGRDVHKIIDFYKNLAVKAVDRSGKLEIETYQLQLAYVAFKKVVKACELNNLELIGPMEIENGRHNEFSPILGIKAGSMKKYRDFVKENHEFIRFGNSLYHQNPNCPDEASGNKLSPAALTMIPSELKEEVDRLSMEPLNKFLKSFDLKYSQVIEENEFWPGVTITSDLDNEYNNWETHAMVDPRGITNKEYNAYVPPQVVTLHELCHVQHSLPGEAYYHSSNHVSSIVEMPCVIDQMILQDEIYKKAKGIGLDKVVDYKNPTQTNRHGGLNPGVIANKFRELKKENGGDTLEALMSGKGKEFVRSYFDSNGNCSESTEGDFITSGVEDGLLSSDMESGSFDFIDDYEIAPLSDDFFNLD